MKKIILSILSICSLNSFAQDLPTADAVIEKYLTALGGKDAISKIQDLTISSTTETQMGTSETELKFKFPDKFSTSTYANGNEIMSAVYDGNKLKRSGFRMMGREAGAPQPPLEGAAAKTQAVRQNIFAELFYKDAGIGCTVIAKEKVGEKDAYKLECTTSDSKKWNDYFDAESGLKVQTLSENETPRGKMTSVVKYSDYKKFKGMDILLPAKTTRTAGQMGEITSEIQSVKVNKGLKDSDFVVKE